MPRSEIETVRRELNSFRRRYPDDPFLDERVKAIRDILAWIERGSDRTARRVLLALTATVAGLHAYVKAKREGKWA